MITQSYSEQNQYTGSVEERLVPPQITPSESIPREKAKYTLDPADSENLNVQSNGEYGWVEGHAKENRPELGWTQKDYTASLEAGGMVRNAILSGSYGELKKLRVDSEVNSETITTSWSASVGENLRVGRNAGVAGYLNLGDTASLVTSDQKGVSPQPDFAPNDENVDDLRLIVSDSALIQNDLYVKDSASVSGGLDLKGDARLAHNLYVTGDTEMTGTLRVVDRTYLTGSVQVVGNEAVTGSLHVSKSIYGSENLFLTGNTEITGTLKVVDRTYLTGSTQIIGDEAVTGSLHVSESIYGSDKLYLSGNAEISGNQNVRGNEAVTGSLHVSQSIYGSDNLYMSGNVEISKSLAVSGNIAVTGSTHISGNLYVSGATVLTSSLEVVGTASFDSNVDFGEDVHISGSLTIDKNINVKGTASYINTQDLYVKDKSITIACGSVSPAQAEGAGIDIAGAGVEFHYNSSTDRMRLNKGLDVVGDSNVTGNLNVTQNLHVDTGTAYISHSVLTQSLVLTQSVSHSAVLSQSVTTQSVDLQHVNSSSVEQLNVKSGSVKDAQIVSSSTQYAVIEKLKVAGTSSADFNGAIHVQGNVSSSNDGQFRNVEAANNIHAGNNVIVDEQLYISGSSEHSSIFVKTGSIDAQKSDLSIQNISASNAISASIVSGGMMYGDGRNLINVKASIASSSTWKSYLDFEAGTTQRLYHPFRSTDVFVQVYRWDDPNFHPDLEDSSSFSSPATRVNDAVVKIIDNGVVDISNASAVNGYAVISDAGMVITGSVDLLQVAADYAEFHIPAGNEKVIYRFDHKLGTKNLIVNVFQYADVKDGYGTIMPVQIFPEQIAIPDNNHIDIVFGRAGIDGYIVLGKAGHIIHTFDILPFIESYSLHYGTDGDWSANSFAATTMSADVISAGEYIDAHIVGNRDTGPQYYAERAWGSYTEYTDTGINQWVRNSPDFEDDIHQVSNINKNGDLTIAGSIITNHGWLSTSDVRRKDVIGNIENALEGVKNLNGVRFNWKDSGEPSIGVIAQEINAIYPELTRVVPDLKGQEQMVVNYEGLIGVLVEAIKELSSKVESLEDKIRNENR